MKFFNATIHMIKMISRYNIVTVFFILLCCPACDRKNESVPPDLSLELEISEIKQDGALCSVSVTSNTSEISERGIVYGNAANPTVMDNKVLSVKDDLSFRIFLSDLSVGKDYTVRGYAIDHNKNVYYSEPASFTTLSATSIDPLHPSDLINEYSGYKLLWSDEFKVNGRPSSDHWGYEHGFVRNKEAQYYSDSDGNSEVRDGCLVITARKDHDGHPYTSSSLHTRDKHHFMYGRFEIRAQIPTSPGCWPAIWTVGNMHDWPIGGEIDMMEFYDKSILANVAWSDNKAWTAVWDSKKIPITNWTNKDKNWVEKYHVWRMDWDSNFINLYIDGELLNSINLSETFNKGWQGNTDNPFRDQGGDFGQYFILNLALGGTNGGIIDDTAFPIEYKIDYVRAYQAIE
jgi:beta-glucanase (GH16 family)